MSCRWRLEPENIFCPQPQGWIKPNRGRLKTPNPARDQQQGETDDPRPCRKRLANFDQTKMRDERNKKQNQRNNPYNHRWSFTGVVHFCVFLLFVEKGTVFCKRLATCEMPLCGSTIR